MPGLKRTSGFAGMVNTKSPVSEGAMLLLKKGRKGGKQRCSKRTSERGQHVRGLPGKSDDSTTVETLSGLGCARQLCVFPRNPPRRKVLCPGSPGSSQPGRGSPQAPAAHTRATGTSEPGAGLGLLGTRVTIHPFLSPTLRG